MAGIGLVLEGGGMRGIYTAGVLDVFLEEEIEFDGVIGVSAGAVHGGSFVSKQHGRNIRYFMKYCAHKNFMSVYSLLTTGNAVGEKFCYHDIPDRLDPLDHEAFEASSTAFYVVVTNIETGCAEYKQLKNLRGDSLEYMRASTYMPYVSRIVDINGTKYLDGGIADSIPLSAFEKLGYSRNVVVLTQELEFRRSSDNVPALNWRYRKYPKFLNAIRTRPQQYTGEQEAVKRAVSKGTAFAIRPSSKPQIGRLERNPERLRTLYNLGRKDAQDALPALRKFLADAKTDIEGANAI